VLLDGIAEPAGDAVDRALQARVAERLDLAAVAADQVMVVVAVRRRRLEACDTVASVDPLHEAEIDERVERPVDACEADASPRPSQCSVDLLRAETAILAAEQLDDRAPRAARAIPARAQSRERVSRPAHVRESIFSGRAFENRSH